MFRFGNNNRNHGKLHSLLPAHCGDADSIYSDDGEKPLPGHDIRPPERHRSRSSDLKRSKSRRSVNSNVSSKETINVLENLHGTELRKSCQSLVYPPPEANGDEEQFSGPDAEIETKEPKRGKKKEKKSKRKFW